MGTSEILIIFVIYLVLFGSKGIPSLAQNMGKAIRTFRDASQDIQREIMSSATEIKNEAQKGLEQNRAAQKQKTTPPEGEPSTTDAANSATEQPQKPKDQPNSEQA